MIRQSSILAILAILAIGVSGCAARKKPPCRICRRGDPVRTFIQPARCNDLPDGRYTCDKVIFDPQTVKAK
jgi:hypothetical protein